MNRTNKEIILAPFRSEYKAFNVGDQNRYFSLTGEKIGHYLGVDKKAGFIWIEYLDGLRECVEVRYCLQG